MNPDWKSALSSILPDDFKPEAEAASVPSVPAQSGPLRIEIDRKRAGKTATIISGFTLDDDAVALIARRIKQRLGAGGSSRAGEILIQGDRRNAVDAFLRAEGFKTRLS